MRLGTPCEHAAQGFQQTRANTSMSTLNSSWGDTVCRAMRLTTAAGTRVRVTYHAQHVEQPFRLSMTHTLLANVKSEDSASTALEIRPAFLTPSLAIAEKLQQTLFSNVTDGLLPSLFGTIQGRLIDLVTAKTQ